MSNIKPVVRATLQSATNVVVFALSIWGFAVEADLLFVVGIAALLGILNFFYFYHDQRLLASAEEENARHISESNEKMLQLTEQSRRIETILAEAASANQADEALFHVENMRNASAVTLRKMVSLKANKARILEASYMQKMYQAKPMFGGASDDELKEAWALERAETDRLRSELEAAFKTKIQPDLLALFEELKRRLGKRAKMPEYMPPALEYGMLTGVNPIAEAAALLESLARQLPYEK